MNQPDDILNELRQLSPIVSQINKRNVFSVPDGYFDLLSSELLLQVQSAEPQHITAEMKASVPTGYFDSLSDNIMARIRQEEASLPLMETREISTLVARIGNGNVFSVPENYFASLAQDVLSKTAGLDNTEIYTETHRISPIVAGIGGKNVFSVPDGYFDELEKNLIGKLSQPAKVVSMKNRVSTFRYAAAAVITGLLGLSLFFFLGKENDNQPTPSTAAVLTDAKQIIQTNSFDKEFSTVSDAAIVSYLESKGQDVEAALVASLTDDKNLPEAEDYILNENTLDEMLNTLDLNN